VSERGSLITPSLARIEWTSAINGIIVGHAVFALSYDDAHQFVTPAGTQGEGE
jgi:hypothetical protein